MARRSQKKARERAMGKKWQDDRAAAGLPSSLEVLMTWISQPANAQRWRNGQFQKMELYREIVEALKAQRISHRSDDDVKDKMRYMNKQFSAATMLLKRSEKEEQFQRGLAGQEIENAVQKLCPNYRQLLPAFGNSVVGNNFQKEKQPSAAEENSGEAEWEHVNAEEGEQTVTEEEDHNKVGAEDKDDAESDDEDAQEEETEETQREPEQAEESSSSSSSESEDAEEESPDLLAGEVADGTKSQDQLEVEEAVQSPPLTQRERSQSAETVSDENEEEESNGDEEVAEQGAPEEEEAGQGSSSSESESERAEDEAKDNSEESESDEQADLPTNGITDEEQKVGNVASNDAIPNGSARELPTPVQQEPAPSSDLLSKRSRADSEFENEIRELKRQALVAQFQDETTQRQELFKLERAKAECELQQKQMQLLVERTLARNRLLNAGIELSEVDRVLPLL